MNIDQLLASHRLVSDQVTTQQLRVILTELAAITANGDIVELGCYIGTTSLFIQRWLREHQPERSFHVYDSFAGLPAKTTQDESRAGEQFQAGELAVSKKQFLQQFQKAGLPAPIVHKAWFADLEPTDMPAQIAFAFLDGDFYNSIRDSLALVLPRLQPGGCLVVDDYAREALPGAAKAVHEFLPAAAIRSQHNLGIYHKPRS